MVFALGWPLVVAFVAAALGCRLLWCLPLVGFSSAFCFAFLFGGLRWSCLPAWVPLVRPVPPRRSVAPLAAPACLPSSRVAFLAAFWWVPFALARAAFRFGCFGCCLLCVLVCRGVRRFSCSFRSASLGLLLPGPLLPALTHAVHLVSGAGSRRWTLIFLFAERGSHGLIRKRGVVQNSIFHA